MSLTPPSPPPPSLAMSDLSSPSSFTSIPFVPETVLAPRPLLSRLVRYTTLYLLLPFLNGVILGLGELVATEVLLSSYPRRLVVFFPWPSMLSWTRKASPS
ncbi:MAG: hypothetical protein DHS80DRAFT_32245 [Piptocephalis tieghemiana]|nr:MAG: hypothetical protein DHS80DRAFT_32245 [Piptocephalis tieghemiana]